MDPKMVCAFKITCYWRGRLEGNGRLLEGGFLKISSNLLDTQGSERTGLLPAIFHEDIPTPVDQLFLVFEVVMKAERIFKE